ncbi:hypothetical protein GCM10028808_70390 [Spirosoma migulaei]
MAEVNKMPDTPPVQLKHFTKAAVAKFTMATVMLQPASIISVEKSEDLYIVSYVRPSDSQRFTYKVKIDGNRAIWANIDGRWRDTPDDEYITFNEVGKKLQITEVYSDKSTNVELYSK